MLCFLQNLRLNSNIYRITTLEDDPQKFTTQYIPDDITINDYEIESNEHTNDENIKLYRQKI